MSSKWSAYGYSEVGQLLLLDDLTTYTTWQASPALCNVAGWSHTYESLSGAVLWDYWLQYMFACMYNFGSGHPDGGDSYVDALVSAGFIGYIQSPLASMTDSMSWNNIANHHNLFAASSYLTYPNSGSGYPLFFAITSNSYITNSGITS